MPATHIVMVIIVKVREIKAKERAGRTLLTYGLNHPKQLGKKSKDSRGPFRSFF